MARSVETLIFVDVDGVLNVGIADPVNGGLLGLSRANIERAQQRLSSQGAKGGAVGRLVAAQSHSLGDEENATLEKFVLNPSTGVSDELVARLALLIGAAERPTVVLSSSWRRPQHAARLRRLEAALSEAMGRPFRFDASIEGDEDFTPEGRLQAIGDFVAAFRRQRCHQLRVLVLEDFHATAFGDWTCGGASMPGIEAAERYLRGRAAWPAAASVRIVHPYDEWTTDDGLAVQVGKGLTMGLFRGAMDFLTERASAPAVSHACSVQETEVVQLESRWLERWPAVIKMLSCM